MKNSIILIIIMYFILSFSSCKNMASEHYDVYSDTITLNGDSRKLFIEIGKENLPTIRWGIENAERHRLPVINESFDKTTGRLSGNLTFFGEDVFGSIEGKIINNKLKGNLIWHRDTIQFIANKIDRKLPYKEEEVSFKNKEVTLKGTLITPTASEKPFPVVMVAHGSGSNTRWWGMNLAAELSKIGVATLLHDKRGCGESTGSKWYNSSLDDLAKDIISGMKFLEQHPSIDKKRIGIYGVSQGCWVASRVNSMTNNLAFVIANSGGGITPYEEEVFSYDINMKFAGIDEKGRGEGNFLVKEYLQYLKTGLGRVELQKQMDDKKNTVWFNVLGLDRIFVSQKNRINWEWVATYNPKDDINNMKIPVLLLFGDQDFQQPTKISVEKWKQALDEGGNKKYTIKVYKGAGHGLSIGGHHVIGFPKYAEYLDEIKEFILKIE